VENECILSWEGTTLILNADCLVAPNVVLLFVVFFLLVTTNSSLMCVLYLLFTS